jgi:hypothetical protein
MVSSGFLQEPHGVTTQKTPFFIVTAVKTSNLTYDAKALDVNEWQGMFPERDPTVCWELLSLQGDFGAYWEVQRILGTAGPTGKCRAYREMQSTGK